MWHKAGTIPLLLSQGKSTVAAKAITSLFDAFTPAVET